ncbi:MAG: hypothetical protein JW795_14385 [Chitinivibrionales bacterium]|nr:hypothetical protein [Chitinivibrionales bacterium]
MHFRIQWWFPLLFFLTTFLYASEELEPEVHALFLQGIDLVWHEEYKEALDHTKLLIKKFPENPVGYFLYGATLNTLMEYLESDKYEEEMYSHCDLAIEKSELLLKKKPHDIWAQFFNAGANGIKGKYESRSEQWITAFKHGWRGVLLLNEIQKKHPEIVDVSYGIATYEYWRSAKMKLLWWMPGVEDRREPSIQALTKVAHTGIYCKESATMELISALFNENRLKEATSILDTFMKQYPNNYFCLAYRVKISLGLKENVRALSSLKRIIAKLDLEERECNSAKINWRYTLMSVYFTRKQYADCLREYEEILSYKLSNKQSKYSQSTLQKAAALGQKARQSISGGSQHFQHSGQKCAYASASQ